jgi:hypothetical protein
MTPSQIAAALTSLAPGSAWTVPDGTIANIQWKSSGQAPNSGAIEAAVFDGPGRPWTMAISSASTPSLDGAYAIDAASLAKINGVASYITINGRFPGGQSSLAWLDVGGEPHVFNSTGQFLSFASAVADYEAQIDLGLALSQPTVIP